MIKGRNLRDAEKKGKRQGLDENSWDGMTVSIGRE
jgi:hypothetical protein